jgi:hypothetical protein
MRHSIARSCARARIARRTSAASLSLALVVAATAVAGSGSDPKGEPPGPGNPTADAAVTRAHKREAARSSAAGRERRKLSRGAYASATDAHALEVFRDNFPAVLASPVIHGIGGHNGERVAKYTTDHSALVDVPGGGRAVVSSTLPLRVDHGSEHKVPVDLRPQDLGSGFELAAPLVRTELGKRASAGFAFPDLHVAVRPLGASAAEASVVDDKLFYPNVDTDTDELLMPLPTGVEHHTVLRSAASPQDIEFKIDLPPDAAIRLVPGANGFPESAQIVRDGEPLISLAPATAADATGEPVETSYRLHADVLAVHVEHRAGSFQYPILVDPSFRVDETKNACSSALNPDTCNHWSDMRGWSYGDVSAGYDGSVGSYVYQSGTHSGLLIKAVPGNYKYDDWAQWVYTAPRD